MRVVQRRRALYGLLIYLQGYRVGFCFSYGFYRNKVVLLPETHEPFPHSDTDEPEVPVVYVDVHHLTDEAGPGVENAPLAEFALGGRGCWVYTSRVRRFMGFSLPFGGKGVLLTAPLQCGQEPSGRRYGRFSATLKAEGGTHPPCADGINHPEATSGESHAQNDGHRRPGHR